MAVKTVGELDGLDIGKVVTISPQPGMTITDEVRSVIHGDAVHSLETGPLVFVAFKNVAPRKAFEFTTDGFKFDAADKVEVHD